MTLTQILQKISSVFAKKSELSNYLPLGGGKLTGNVTWELPADKDLFNMSMGSYINVEGTGWKNTPYSEDTYMAHCCFCYGKHSGRECYIMTRWNTQVSELWVGSKGNDISISGTLYWTKISLDSHNHDSAYLGKTAKAESSKSADSVTWDNVSGKPSSYTPSSHTHSELPNIYVGTRGVSEGGQIYLVNGERGSEVNIDNYYGMARIFGNDIGVHEFSTTGYNGTSQKAIKDSDGNQINTTYSKTTHTHDDRYYTESEMDTKLSSKANTSGTYNNLTVGHAYTTHDNTAFLGFDKKASETNLNRISSINGTNLPNTPYSSISWWEVNNFGSTRRSYQSIYGCFSHQRDIYTRFNHDDNWSPWFQHSLIDSQGDGWIRYSNGLQICWGNLNGTSMWNLPVAFKDDTYYQNIRVNGTSGEENFIVASKDTTTVWFSSGGGNAKYSVFAIGYWK